MKNHDIPNPAIRRLSLYLRQLEAYEPMGQRTVSSRRLAEALSITDTQVRKDLAYFGQFGHPGIGYDVGELIQRVHHILGTDKVRDVLVVGAGNLGRALLRYRGFIRKGFRLIAAIDIDPHTVGTTVAGVPLFPLEQLEQIIANYSIRLAILAVPTESAQQVCDRLTAAGVVGILNFAPITISQSPGVTVHSVDLAVELEQISFQVNLLEQ